MNYLDEIKKRELLILQVLSLVMFFLMLIFAFAYIDARIEHEQAITYTYTGTDQVNSGYGEQYFIRYMENDRGFIRQIEITASSAEEVGEIKRYMRGRVNG